MVWIILALTAPPLAAAGPGYVMRTQTFDRDPGWEGYGNRAVPAKFPTVTQDFGYSKTAFAAKSPGEIGGQVWRSTTPAYCGARIAPRTLKDRLQASGTFAFTASPGSSGLFFGWFNAKQPGGSRPINSLGMDFDGEGSGLRLAVRLITGANQSCGTFITPFIPGVYRPTPIRNDGTRYTWSLTYDPEANGGKGRCEFTVKGHHAKPEGFEGKVFAVELPDGFKASGIVFDRFGMVNMQRPGHRLTAYFADLQHDGITENLATDPHWDGSGNRATYEDREVGGAQDFGWSDSAHAGGGRGELGGLFWRQENGWAYYGDHVGALTLDDPLTASGKVALRVGAPDSAVAVGWFNSRSLQAEPRALKDFLGIRVEGPTRVGHYFRPVCVTAGGSQLDPKKGPVLVPNSGPHKWTLNYDPAANTGAGSVQVTLDNEQVSLPLPPGHKAQGAHFDRFGVLTQHPGGGLVKVYFDDLRYTTVTSASRGSP